jgi:hypothetical protein
MSNTSLVGTTKRIVCLANSRKPNGRCIAGRELVDGIAGGWIRPVSSREHHEVSEYERQYEDGSDPRVLDVIDVPLIEWTPSTFQQENWLLNPNEYWTKVGTISWDDLGSFTEAAGPLWVNGSKTYHGLNDRVAEEVADKLDFSLRLIHVAGLQLEIFAPGIEFGNRKRRVQAVFHHAGSRYRLWVTDPIYERKYLAQPDGVHDLGECYLTMSLGEPHDDGYCYKLVAAIIEPPTVPGGTAG